jgi:hypothetical protein
MRRTTTSLAKAISDAPISLAEFSKWMTSVNLKPNENIGTSGNQHSPVSVSYA